MRRATGLTDVAVEGIEIPTTFPDLDAYCRPATCGSPRALAVRGTAP